MITKPASSHISHQNPKLKKSLEDIAFLILELQQETKE